MAAYFWRFIFFTLFFAGTLEVSAKCGLGIVMVKGQIVSVGENVTDASVYVLLDEQDHTSYNGYESGYPDYVTPMESGEFETNVYFATYSGSYLFGRDRCDRVPTVIDVVVVKNGFFLSRKRILMKDAKRVGTFNVEGDDVPVLDIGTVEIRSGKKL